MSDELQKLGKGIGDSVSEFSSAPRIKAAFNAMAATWPVAVGALAAGFVVKPLLPLAFLGAVGYAGYKGVRAYLDYQEPPPPASKPNDFNLG